MAKGFKAAAAGLLTWACAAAASFAQPAFDPKPWLEDFRQAQSAMAANYANLEWAVADRGVDLPGSVARMEAALGKARNEAEARRLFERFLSSFGDGHLRVEWPAPGPASAGSPPVRPVCEALGFSDWGPDTRAVGRLLPGYTALDGPDAGVFPAGLVRRDGRTLGVLRIFLFSPDWRPDLCEAARVALKVPAEGPCDENCGRRVREGAEARYTAALARQLSALKAAGADALLLDLAANGGGSEWVNTAAGMMAPPDLSSPVLGVIRHPDFAKMLRDQAEELRTAAAAARGEERAFLTRYAAQAGAVAEEAAKPCDRTPLWRGERVGCSGLVTRGLYVSGFSPTPLPPQWRARPWAGTVYGGSGGRGEPIWRGPMAIIVDGNTASASEQLVAQLQSAKRAVIVGSPTHGSGCGYITGSHGRAGSETVLKNSGGKLFMPNCARFLPDGRNEVGGLEPDVLLPFRPNDTAQQKARRLEAAMPRVLAALPR
jgi:hypothetical protein